MITKVGKSAAPMVVLPPAPTQGAPAASKPSEPKPTFESGASVFEEKIYTLGRGVGHYLLNDNFGTLEGGASTALMRKHLWLSSEKTWIQGVYLQLYQKGTLTKLLTENGVAIPPRYAEGVAAPAR